MPPRTKKVAIWVQCMGEAHSNPYIDNCMICAPWWETYPACGECGKRLTRTGFCQRCRTWHRVDRVDVPVSNPWKMGTGLDPVDLSRRVISVLRKTGLRVRRHEPPKYADGSLLWPACVSIDMDGACPVSVGIAIGTFAYPAGPDLVRHLRDLVHVNFHGDDGHIAGAYWPQLPWPLIEEIAP